MVRTETPICDFNLAAIDFHLKVSMVIITILIA